MSELSASDLIDWGRQGFFLGPEEEVQLYVKRIDFSNQCDSCSDILSLHQASLRDRVTLDEWTPIYREIERRFQCVPKWVLGYYSNHKLMPWQGGVTWVLPHAYCGQFPVIQLNKGFKKGHYFFYSRHEVLMHETIHALRTSYSEPRFEEFFAFSVSNRKWRTFLGPLFRRPGEIWFFFLTCALSLIAQVSAPFISDSFLLFSFGLFPFIYFVILMFKLIYDWSLFGRAKQTIQLLFPHLKDPLALACRLTDKEVCLFARRSRNDLFSYISQKKGKCLRWKQITQQLNLEINNN